MAAPLARGLVVGLVFGTVYGVALRAAVELDALDGWLTALSLSFLLLVPAVIGYLTVRFHPSPGWGYTLLGPWLPLVAGAAVAMLLGWEGRICILLGMPLMLILASLGGCLGRPRRLRNRATATAIVLLPLALGPLEEQWPEPTTLYRVTDSIEIAAPTEAVWREIVEVREIAPEEMKPALFTRLGFPRPLAATLDRPGVGGVRQATFAGGVLFLETIHTWEEGRVLGFSIAAQTDRIPPTTLDPHVTIGGRYFDVLEGVYTLEPLDGGRLRLHLASRLRLTTHLNPYAGPWAETIMASIQRNILEVIRSRAETAPV